MIRRLLVAAAAVAGLLVLAVAGVAAWGATMPADHEASGDAVVAATPERVFARIADPAAYPHWRTGVRTVQTSPGGRWVETGDNGTMPYRFGTRDEPRSLETIIDSTSLPFSGTWTFELSPAPGGTLVRITERGHVPAPPMRALARVFAPPDATLRRYLADLKASFARE
jgi:uncharacterized protein YndB with AHSA1/START domain